MKGGRRSSAPSRWAASAGPRRLAPSRSGCVPIRPRSSPGRSSPSMAGGWPVVDSMSGELGAIARNRHVLDDTSRRRYGERDQREERQMDTTDHIDGLNENGRDRAGSLRVSDADRAATVGLLRQHCGKEVKIHDLGLEKEP